MRRLNLLHEWILLVTASLGVLVTLGIRWEDNEPERPTPDEITYSYFTQRVHPPLFEGYSGLVDEFMGNKQRWVYPNPFRLSLIVIPQLLQPFVGESPLIAGRRLAFAASLLGIGVTVFLSGRLWGISGALTCLLLAATFPPDLASSGRFWGETLMAASSSLLILSLYWLTLGKSKFFNSKFLGWFLLFISILLLFWTKESGALALAAFLIALGVMAFRDRRSRSDESASPLSATITYKFVLVITLSSLIWWCVQVLTLATVAGGFARLSSFYSELRIVHLGNEYTQLYLKGPWYSLFEMLWQLCPALLIAACAGMVLSILRGNSILQMSSLLVMFYGLSISIPEGMANLRFFAPAYPAIILLGTFALCSTIKRIVECSSRYVSQNSFGLVYGVITIAVASLISAQQYYSYEVLRDSGALDLSYRWIVPQ